MSAPEASPSRLPVPGTVPHPMGPSGLGFEGWHLRPEITFWLQSDVFRGLEPCFGVSYHSSELPFPYLEDGSSGPRPSLSPTLTLGRVAKRDSVTPQVKSPGQLWDQERICDGGNAGRWGESASLGTSSSLGS